MINVFELTRKNLKEVPLREFHQNVGYFDSIIIIPMRKLHDSGYKVMTLVGCRDCKAEWRVADCADSIGFIGDNYRCECLPQSSFINIWVPGKKLYVLSASSSINIMQK